VDRGAVHRMTELGKANARLNWLVAETELDILILKEVADREIEPGAAAPGSRARDGRAEVVAAASVPRGGPAPEHAAPPRF